MCSEGHCTWFVCLCLSVCLSVCLSPLILDLQGPSWLISDTNGSSATGARKVMWRFCTTIATRVLHFSVVHCYMYWFSAASYYQFIVSTPSKILRQQFMHHWPHWGTTHSMLGKYSMDIPQFVKQRMMDDATLVCKAKNDGWCKILLCKTALLD